MVLPNIFATTPAGNVPAAELDQNFTFLESQGIQGVVATGSANSYLIDPADAWGPAYANYINRPLIVSFPASNTGSSVADVSGLGNIPMVKNVSGVVTNLAAGDVTLNIPYLIICDGTRLWVYSFGSASGGGATPTAIDVHANFNAVPDCRSVDDVVTNSGSPIIASATANFTNADAGKIIKIYNYSTGVGIFLGTILSVTNATTAVLNGNALSSATAGNALAYFGTDNATQINAALAYAATLVSQNVGGVNAPNGAGYIPVIFPVVPGVGDGYLFGTSLTTYRNVLLDTQSMLYNAIGLGINDRNWAIQCTGGMQVNRIVMECGGGMGIQNGTVGGQSSSFIGQVQLWNVGTNFNSGLTPPSQIALELSGNDYTITGYWCKGGNIGVHLFQASDVRFSLPEVIGSATGMQLAGCENVQINNVTFDTCSFVGLMIDGSHNITANGNMFSVNATGLTYGIATGLNDSTNINRVLNLDFNMQRSGGTALHLAYSQDWKIDLLESNSANYSAGGVPLTASVEFGAGNTGWGLIQAIRGDVAITQSSGSVTGILWDLASTQGASSVCGGSTTISTAHWSNGLLEG